MEQLLLHLIGDYVTQTDWMARTKTRANAAAACHAVVYTLPFLLLSPSPAAKNKVTDWQLRWADCNATGFPGEVPAARAFWLMILIDNTMHLSINYAALRWL